jgi:hypothetical protein
MFMRISQMAIFLTLLSCVATAQQTLEKGSAERKAILDALRPRVEKDLKQPITFVVNHLKMQGTWAFVSGAPQTPTGGRPSLKGTAWQGSEDTFDDNFFALMRKAGGKWRVVAHALGCTDVCYLDWPRRYNAPRAVFFFPY